MVTWKTATKVIEEESHARIYMGQKDMGKVSSVSDMPNRPCD